MEQKEADRMYAMASLMGRMQAIIEGLIQATLHKGSGKAYWVEAGVKAVADARAMFPSPPREEVAR